MNENYKMQQACMIFVWQKNYVVHLKASKQALNHGLTVKKVHRITQFNKKTSLKAYIDMDTKLRTEAKNDFEKKDF